jgi:hypothetical protein
MTLHEAAKHFRWDATHDYQQHDTRDGELAAIYGLGLYEADLIRLKEMVPGLVAKELRHVVHDHDTWLRVDVMVAP